MDGKRNVDIKDWNSFAISVSECLKVIETDVKWIKERQEQMIKDIGCIDEDFANHVSTIDRRLSSFQTTYRLFAQKTQIQLGWRSTIIAFITTISVLLIALAISRINHIL